jgi:hypothetical protein
MDKYLSLNKIYRKKYYEQEGLVKDSNEKRITDHGYNDNSSSSSGGRGSSSTYF